MKLQSEEKFLICYFLLSTNLSKTTKLCRVGILTFHYRVESKSLGISVFWHETFTNTNPVQATCHI